MNPTGYAKPQNDPSPDTESLSEDGESEEEEGDKKSDSGLSSDGEIFDDMSHSSSGSLQTSQRKSFLHFLKKTNIPGPTHAGNRDL